MSTWKDREKVGNMIEDCARGNLPIDDALDIIESLVNESTPTNTPTSKCDCKCPCSCHGYSPCLHGKLPGCTAIMCECDPAYPPTTDSKNSSENWEKEFDERWGRAIGNLALSRPELKDFIRREIAAAEQTAYTRGKKDTVEFIRENCVEVRTAGYGELGQFTDFKYALDPKTLEAALTNPKD